MRSPSLLVTRLHHPSRPYPTPPTLLSTRFLTPAPDSTAAAVSQALAQSQATGNSKAVAQALSQAVNEGGGAAAQAVAQAYAQVMSCMLGDMFWAATVAAPGTFESAYIWMLWSHERHSWLLAAHDTACLLASSPTSQTHTSFQASSALRLRLVWDAAGTESWLGR
jgi:hypothetical protein